MPNIQRKFHNPARLLKLARLLRVYLVIFLPIAVLAIIPFVTLANQALMFEEYGSDSMQWDLYRTISNNINNIFTLALFALMAYLLPKMIYALLKLHGDLQKKNL